MQLTTTNSCKASGTFVETSTRAIQKVIDVRVINKIAMFIITIYIVIQKDYFDFVEHSH